MTPEQWRHVRDAFHAAFALDPDARGAWLAAHCDDPDVRAEVRALLANADAPDAFLAVPGSATTSAETTPADASAPHRAAGDRIGSYVIERELGRGGMGVAYLARDVRLGRQVALKVLPSPFRADTHRRERLWREARAVARISHAGVATVYAVEDDGADLCIVSEYVPGSTLREWLGRGPLPSSDVRSIAMGLARGLEAVHAQGVVHRDLKPENVIRRPDGAVTLIDFGLALAAPSPADGPSESRLTLTGTLLGTPAYMAPEQLAGHDVDARADIYAFGVVVYELATGRHPFAPTATPAGGVPPAPTPAEPAIDAGLAPIVERCLQALPSRRFEDGAALVAALGALEAPRPAPVVPGSPPPVAASWWQAHQLVVSLVYAVMAVLTWFLRAAIGGGGGRVFLGTVALVTTLAVLRLHGRFVSRVHPDTLLETHRRARPWLVAGDLVLAGGLLVVAVVASDRFPILSAVLTVLVVAHIVTFARVEPATWTAAFGAAEGRERTGAAPTASIGIDGSAGGKIT